MADSLLVSPGFEFEEAAHAFKLDGKAIPGVTALIEDMGYREPGADFYTKASRQRGTACHKACELVDIHCPQARTLDEVLAVIDLKHPDPAMVALAHGYIAGYLLFKSEWDFQPLADGNEVIAVSRTWRYGGIMDKLGHVKGRPAVADLKTWRPRPTKPKRGAELQICLYRILAKEYRGFVAETGLVVDLPGDGSYRAWEADNPVDMAMVLAFPRIWWDRNKHGYARARGEEYE